MRVMSSIPTGLLCLFVFSTTDVEGYASWCEMNQTVFVPEESTATFRANFTFAYHIRFRKTDNSYHYIFRASVRDNNITDDDVTYYDRSWEHRTQISIQLNTDGQFGVRIDVSNISMKDNGTYRLYEFEDACFILFVMQIRLEPTGAGAIEENKPVYVYAHPHSSVITRPFANATMIWLLDGLSMNQTASFVQRDGLIWILNILRDLDGKNITYRAVHDNGNVNDINYTLNVMYGPNQPLTLVPRQTQYYLVSGDVMPDITCETGCKPRCSISWGKYSNSGTLRLGTVTRDDTGEYTCTATRTGVKTVERTIHIYVADEKAWLMQLSPNKDVYIVSVGDIMPEIMCTADCNPPCDVSWGVHSSNGQLSLRTVAIGMDAEYICTATRKGSSRRVEKSITVHVQDEQAWSVTITPKKTVYIMSLGETMPDISCTADCYTPCIVSWGIHSPNGELRLGTVSKDMKGEYICTATRKGSKRRVEKSVTIHVQDNTSFTTAIACLATVQALTTLGLGLCAFLIYRRNKQPPCKTCFKTSARQSSNRNTVVGSKSTAEDSGLQHYEDLDTDTRYVTTVSREVNVHMTALPTEAGLEIYENTKLSPISTKGVTLTHK